VSKPIEAVLVGAGNRGANAYGPFALRYPDQLQFIAVAEPIDERRLWFAQQHQIPSERQYRTWEDLLSIPQLARAVLICTQDQMHVGPTIAALKSGYDILLEKPIASTPAACKQVVEAAQNSNQHLLLCHVLRYTHHFQKIREIVHSGTLGQIIHVDHQENVSWWHMAHSYVRGAWSQLETSSPMILAKCCHDFDILLWILGKDCESLSSVGALTHFHPENAPDGAPQRCLDGCPASEDCPYYAPWIYIDLVPLWRDVANSSSVGVRQILKTHLHAPKWIRALSTFIPTLRQVSDYKGWPLSVLAVDPTRDKIIEALQTTAYGHCVYHCENDVVDHQVVLMQFEESTSVTLTMQGHASFESRRTRIAGTQASLTAFLGLGGSWIETRERRSGQIRRYNTTPKTLGAHGGGDEGLLRAFVKRLREGSVEETHRTADEILSGHLLAFAAEEARLEKKVISFVEDNRLDHRIGE
jgi:predicted dehydrogenase